MNISYLANGGGNLKASSVHRSRLQKALRNPFISLSLKAHAQPLSGGWRVVALLLVCVTLFAVACTEEDDRPAPAADPSTTTRTQEPAAAGTDDQVQVGGVVINTQWGGEEHYTY